MYCFLAPTSTQPHNIKLVGATGAAEFAGNTFIGNAGNTYVFCDPTGFLSVKSASASTSAAFGVTRVGESDYNATIFADGSARFAGDIISGPGDPYAGVELACKVGDGTFVATRSGSQDVWNGFQQGSTYVTSAIKADGSATFTGSVTSASSFAIQLEADDDTKYTATTDSEGNETRVYNGAVLDVKERIQNVIARMDAIEANEVTDDATDSALLTLVANLSSRLDERDVQIAALTARITTLEGA